MGARTLEVSGGGYVPQLDMFPLRLTEEILHHLRLTFTQSLCRMRPSRTPTLTLKFVVSGHLKKRGPMYGNLAPPHPFPTLSHGGAGGRCGLVPLSHRREVRRYAVGEVVQDFFRQPSGPVRTQEPTC